MTIDTKQIGGSHYGGGEIQHWDFVVRCLDNRYLEGNATKYLDRWQKKEGLQDLKKARSYVSKLITEVACGRIKPLDLHRFLDTEDGELTPARFCNLRDHEPTTRLAIGLLAYWQTASDLLQTLQLVDDLIGRLESNAPTV